MRHIFTPSAIPGCNVFFDIFLLVSCIFLIENKLNFSTLFKLSKSDCIRNMHLCVLRVVHGLTLGTHSWLMKSVFFFCSCWISSFWGFFYAIFFNIRFGSLLKLERSFHLSSFCICFCRFFFHISFPIFRMFCCFFGVAMHSQIVFSISMFHSIRSVAIFHCENEKV